VKSPIQKQTPISNLIFGKLLKKFGVTQMISFHKTRKKNPVATYPYMPSEIPEDAYLYDFHSHTYHSDGKGTYEEILIDLSQKKHINGLAVTDHPWHHGEDGKERIPDGKVIDRSYKFNQMVEDYKKKGKLHEDFISFPGSSEFFTMLDEDNEKHEVEIIGIGLSKEFVKDNGGIKRLTSECYAEELIEKIHDDNGLAILPHPFYFERAYELLRRDLPNNSRPDAYEGINYTIGFLYDDGYRGFWEKLPFTEELVMICQNFGYFNWMATLVSQENNFGKYFNFPIAQQIATVGSSDAHFQSMIGAACTVIKEPINNIEDLRKVFHERRTIPIINSKWDAVTKSSDVYSEIWDAYGEIINKGLKDNSLFRWILSKTIVDLLQHFPIKL